VVRDNVYDADERAACARKNFLDGYNCSQSVVMAYVDAFEQAGIDPEVVARVAAPFGGGMARMREVCGCVSGSLMIMGLVEGYSDPKAYAAKKRLYEQVQEVAGRYRDENGSIVCRELLGLGKGADVPTPERRTQTYYRKRPCADLCASAARIMAEYLNEIEAAGD
jgi:C_GCAxxG_C_C family probable redox protein